MKNWLNTKIHRLIAKPSRLTTLFLIGLIALYAGWLGYVIIKDRPIDFYVYYLAAEEMARGGDPYTISDQNWDSLAADLNITNYTAPYRYPPQSALLIMLLRPIGPRGAMIVWIIGDAVALVAGAWIFGKALGGSWWLPISLGTLLLFVSPLATLLAGQVNGYIFLCLTLAYAAIKNSRPIRWGLSLAIGAVLKVIPVALIFYALWRRQWKAGLIGLGAIVVLTVICLPFLNSNILPSYAQHAIALGNPGDVGSSPTNQTITALFQRLLIDQDAAITIGKWLSLLIIVITIGICWPIGSIDQLMPLEFGLIVAALQIIPPFTWYHQWVLVLIPLLITAQYLWRYRQRRWIWILIGLFVLSNVHGLIYRQLNDLSPLLASFPFIMAVTVWIMLATIIIKQKFQRISNAPLVQPS